MVAFTREELYELVWSESRLTLAKRLGVSDVWIRKACVKADIPVPPPGYWARVAAGNATARLPLPARGLGKGVYVQLGRDDRRSWSSDDPIVVPPAIQFPESIDVVRVRAQRALGRTTVPRGLQRVAPAIAPLLAEDEERKAELAKHQYAWKKPRFDSPAAQRRVRILNALLLMLEQGGCRGSVDKHDLSLYITVGDTGLHLSMSAKGLRRNDRRYDERRFELADANRETLILTLERVEPVDGLQSVWGDSAEAKLERQLPRIVTELLVWGEMQYRTSVARSRQWAIEAKERQEAEILRKRIEAARAEAERLARQEKARRDHLLRLANSLRESDAIRGLVTAVTSAGRTEELSDWCNWALETADRLDPRRMPIEQLMGGDLSSRPN